MRLFLNAVAASAASGLTYIRNIVPHLAARDDVETTVLTSGRLQDEFTAAGKLKFLTAPQGLSAVRRFWWEQRELPNLIRSSGADVLLSAGNFALRRSPVPQILLSGNALYCSDNFRRDLLKRGEYRTWFDLRIRSWFARRSIHWADYTVVPSQAFAQQLQAWSAKEVVAVHHGFDEQLFRADMGPLPPELERKLKSAEGSLRLLYVSHYNYFRNFETLFRALSLIRSRVRGQKVKLLLTCELKRGTDISSYDPQPAAELVRQLGIEADVVQLGIVRYGLIHHVYEASDIYVTTSYAETFAHPTVEAMSCGLPIVASDLAVHHEICQDAALYFRTFSPEELADCVANVAESQELAQKMSQSGRRRARDFSWAKHVESLLELAKKLAKPVNACHDRWRLPNTT